MPLKVVVKDINEVDEALRAAYTQVGDEYVLDTDDGEFKQRLSEFRSNNIDLNKKLGENEGKLKEIDNLKNVLKNYEGLDPDEARKALDTMRNINEQKLIDAGKLDEVLGQRTERMRSDYEGKIKALESNLTNTRTEGETFKKRLTEVVIDNSLQAAVGTVAPVKKGAMQDVLHRGRGVWSLNEEGKPVPVGSDGKVMYGTDGQSTLSMEEWAQSLVQDAPYLFEANSGGGSGGGMKKPDAGDGRMISAMDQDGLNANIENIAAGKVQVSNT